MLSRFPGSNQVHTVRKELSYDNPRLEASNTVRHGNKTTRFVSGLPAGGAVDQHMDRVQTIGERWSSNEPPKRLPEFRQLPLLRGT